MNKYEGNVMNYVGTMKEYVKGSVNWENFELYPLYGLWEKKYEGKMKKYEKYI